MKMALLRTAALQKHLSPNQLSHMYRGQISRKGCCFSNIFGIKTLSTVSKHVNATRLISKPSHIISTGNQSNKLTILFVARSAFSTNIKKCASEQSTINLGNKPKKVYNPRKTKKGNLDPGKKVRTDVLVYSHDNDKYYKMLSFFGVFQMSILVYLASAVQQYKTVPSEVMEAGDLPWWKWLIYKQGQFKNSLSALCLAVGLITLTMTLTYPQRSVKRLWLLQGGENVKVLTYSVFGRNSAIEVPVAHLNCQASRAESGAFIPIKVKDKKLFYMLDKQGTFHNHNLFDFAIGLRRTL